MEEEEYVVKSHGTRSRPRQPVYDLDSEGSEVSFQKTEKWQHKFVSTPFQNVTSVRNCKPLVNDGTKLNYC